MFMWYDIQLFQGDRGDTGPAGMPGQPGINGTMGPPGTNGTKVNMHYHMIITCDSLYVSVIIIAHTTYAYYREILE